LPHGYRMIMPFMVIINTIMIAKRQTPWNSNGQSV